MPFSLEKKVAVVTGGGSGIGRAIAVCFADQQAEVHVVELNADAATEVQQTVRAKGGRLDAHACDVSNQPEVIRVVSSIVEKSGRIDILVNSAGIAKVSNLETTTEQDLEKLFQVNVKGTYNTMYAVMPHMRKQQRGAILNLASAAATVGIPDRFAYSMTKGAVVSMTLSVAKDYVTQGIRCNCISPGRVHTPFVDGFITKNYPGREKEMFEKLSRTQPIGRMARPEEIAYLALYLCSDEASFVTGSDYAIDGGFIRLNN